MKYLLKQNKEDKGILCDKVTIDGFDYYVNFGWINNLTLKKNIYLYNSTFKEIGKVISIYGGEFSVELLDKCISGWAIKELCQKVIATNNPYVDLPKVVDEVDNLLSKIYKQFRTGSFLKRIKCFYAVQLMRIGYNKSQETHPNSDEDMIEFTSWCSLNGYSKHQVNDKWYDGEDYVSTSKELLQLWKSQQPKVLYYE